MIIGHISYVYYDKERRYLSKKKEKRKKIIIYMLNVDMLFISVLVVANSTLTDTVYITWEIGVC